MKKLLLVLCAVSLIAGCAAKTRDSDTPGISEIIDLTVMNSNAVYAEVYGMMTSPEDYMGKTVKIKGVYAPSYYDKTGMNYHYVLIADALACCRQGIEFIWNGEHKYPDDYPKEGETVEITGVFGKYDELGETYYYLATDGIERGQAMANPLPDK